MNPDLDITVIWSLSILAGAAVVWLASEFAKYRAAQIDTQAALREEFFRHAEHLIDDPATPEEIALSMGTLALALPKAAVMRGFFFHALGGRTKNPGSFREEYAELPPHLRKDFVIAWVSAVFALTYNNLLLGPIIRRLMLYGVQRDGDISTAMPVAPLAYDLSHRAV